MKKLFITALILIATATQAQRVVLLDTTYNGNRFIYNAFYGDIHTTLVHDTLNEIVIRIFNKVRVVGTNDTIQKSMDIRIPYLSVKDKFDAFFNSNIMKKEIRRALKDDYKKKIGREFQGD